jgi:hypothetical protein
VAWWWSVVGCFFETVLNGNFQILRSRHKKRLSDKVAALAIPNLALENIETQVKEKAFSLYNDLRGMS